MYPQLPCLREYFALEGIADKHINEQQLQLRQDAGGTGNITDATKEANNINDFAGGALVSEMNRLKARLGLTGSFHINSLIRQACDEGLYGYGFTFEGSRFLPATVPHRIDGGFAYAVGDRSRLPVIGIGLLGNGTATLTFPFDLVASDVITLDNGAVTRDDANDRVTLDNTSKIWGIKVETSAGALRGFYQCSEGEAVTVYDRSGNNNHATLSTVSVWAKDETFGSFNNEIGSAKGIRFSPTDEFTDFGTTANASVGGTAKRTFKVKLVSFSFSTTQVYWSIFQVVGNNRAFQFGIDVFGNPFIVLSEDGEAGTTNSYFATSLTATINTNIELQVVFLPSDSVVFTLNGVSETVSITESGIFASSTDSLKQGSDIVTFDQMNAFIYESSILDENDEIIIEPSFNKHLRDATQYTKGSSNPTGTLTGGAAIIYLPLVENTDLAVFGVPATGLPNTAVAVRLNMTGGICKDLNGTTDFGDIAPNVSFSINGKWAIGIKKDVITNQFLIDTRDTILAETGWFCNSSTDGLRLVLGYENSSGIIVQNMAFGVDDMVANESNIEIEIDFSQASGGASVGGIGTKFKVKQQLDSTVPFEYLPNKTILSIISDAATPADQTITHIRVGGFALASAAFHNGTMWDFKSPDGQHYPIQEDDGNSKSIDGIDTIVWQLPNSGWGTTDQSSFYNEQFGGNKVGSRFVGQAVDAAGLLTGLDFDGGAIINTSALDTGFELDGTFDSAPELNGTTDTMIADIDLDFSYINSDVNPTENFRDLLWFLLTTQSGYPAEERQKILDFTDNNI